MQLQAIPGLLSRRDAIVGAQTGTGKTASFALPLLQLLATESPPRRHIRALILTPTRELAAQVEQSIRSYGRYLRLRSTAVFGGVSINPQIQTLREGVDILVATPGRLLDHVRGKTVDLRQVEFLVLDEADRMLDMGFIRDIRRIFEALPAQRQNLFFSATYSPEIRQFADSFLNAPLEIAVSRKQATADLIRQVVHPVDKGGKRALLSWLIGSGDWRQVLVFTRTKHGANRLAEQLVRDGISATAIHGNKSQGARTRALAEFKQGTVRVLVATDIAARGLDIKELPHVVNFELPNVPEDYVHRIGRTGRAGSNGIATSLVCRDEKSLLGDIERLIRLRIESVVVPGFEPGSQSATDEHEEPHTRRAGAKPAQRGQASATQRRQEDGRANRNSRPSERTEHDSAGQRRAADGQPWHARQGKHRSGTGKQDHGNSNGGRRTADNRSAKNAGMKREWSGS